MLVRLVRRAEYSRFVRDLRRRGASKKELRKFIREYVVKEESGWH